MARLATFIDAAYANSLARDTFKLWIDYDKFSNRIHQEIAAATVEPLDLLRTYYYDCLPYQGNPPTQEQAERVRRARRFFTVLKDLSSFNVREGRIAFRGYDSEGQPYTSRKALTCC